MLMPFRDDLDQIYKTYIKEPLDELGYIIQRADDISKSTNILEDIVDNIVKSDIIIADLTYKNPNVFYELGRAHQLNKWMIQIAQEGEKLPFDLQQIRTIFYKPNEMDLQKLKEQIIKFIKSFKKEKYINDVIENFRKSIEYREAINHARYIMENEESITKSQLIKIAKATQENNQIYGSYVVQEILEPLFKKQKALLPDYLRNRLIQYGWM